MDHRRGAAVVGLLGLRVDAQRALLQAPVGPHLDALVILAVLAVDRDVRGQLEHVPAVLDPGADADHDVVGLDTALVRLDGGDGIALHAETGHADAGDDANALGLGLRGQAVHGRGVVGITALLLVQDRGGAGRLPVVEQTAHVLQRVLLALDELGGIADRPLLLGDRGHVLVHALGADLHVADRVVVKGLGVALPDLDAVGHQFAHGRLEVVVADHPAGDAGGAGGDAGLVEHDDVAAVAAAAGAQFAREMPGGAQAVDAGADDHVGRAVGKCHGQRYLGGNRVTVGVARRRLKRYFFGPG